MRGYNPGMKAWIINSLTGIENLRLAEFPEPVAAAGEVVLEVKYAALNPADRYLAEGQYPAKPVMPHVLGRDAVGTIVAVGLGAAKELKVGTRWSVLRGETGVERAGTFAERVIIAGDSLVAIPPGWSDEQAAGATLVYLTAYQALMQWGDVASPVVVLVTGASGGVGVATVQLAKAMGHTVVALSRDAAKQVKLRELGAAVTLDPGDPQWKAALKQQLGKRIDIAVDNIGGTLFNQVVDVMADHGRISVVGRLAGPVPEFNTASLFFRRLRIGGVAVGTYGRAEAHAAWNSILTLLCKTNAKPLVDSVHAFDKLPEAFERLKNGPMGKVLMAVKK